MDAVQVTENDYDAKFPDYGDKDDENAAEVANFEKNLSLEKPWKFLCLMLIRL